MYCHSSGFRKWRDLLFAIKCKWKLKARKAWAQTSPKLVCFQWLGRMAAPRPGQLWTKCFIKTKFSSNICWYLSHNVHLITVDGTQPRIVLENQDLHYKIQWRYPFLWWFYDTSLNQQLVVIAMTIAMPVIVQCACDSTQESAGS